MDFYLKYAEHKGFYAYGVGFQRIRRVTGYLSDTVRMNNAKQVEAAEGIKHVGETSSKWMRFLNYSCF